jgi:hypothetical protein
MSLATATPPDRVPEVRSRRSPMFYLAFFAMLAMATGLVAATVVLLRKPAVHGAPVTEAAEAEPEAIGVPRAPKLAKVPLPLPPPIRTPTSGENPAGAAPLPPPLPGAKSAGEEAAEVVGVVKTSGPAQGNWPTKARATFDAWRNSSSLAGKVELSDFQCFRRGCTFIAMHADRMTFDHALMDMRETEAFQSLNPAAFRSGPIETPSGQIKAVWVLYADEPMQPQ